MIALTRASMAFLLCRPALAFIFLQPPSVYDPPGHPRGNFGGGDSGSRSSLGRPLFAIGTGSTSKNNVAPANGLTTSSTETQNGAGAGHRRPLHPESDIFVPTPCTASLEAALAAGSPHFGDIMGRGEGHRGGQEGSLLRHFDAMERVVLTANGNLQRVISSYYDSPVTVDITYCREVQPSVYEREVEISVFGRVFCIAKSLVVLHNPVCAEAVKNGSVGIGQLFRSLDILPNFELLNAGHRTRPSLTFERTGSEGDSGMGGEEGKRKATEGGLWRVYDLRSRHVSCRIHEEFPPDLFDLK
eukprot:g3755.t1